nr:ribonuclease H-like domain-containing protein [Tanacetum cinerariifolium]
MIDYSLWEVILNGDSPVPTRIVKGILQPVAPTTAEQKLARKNELKARGTLLMALPDKHQLKFNSHKDAKTLMEAIEKRSGGNTETKKVQKTLLKQQYENFTGTATQNLAFMSSSNTDNTTKSVSAAASVFTHIDVDDLKEMDLRWQMVMLTMRANRFIQKTGQNLRANRPTSMGFDMSKVECYNCHRKRHFSRECRSPKDSRRNEEEHANFALMAFSSSSSSSDTEVKENQEKDKIGSKPDKNEKRGKAGKSLESIKARLLVYKQNESVFEENIKLFNIEVQLRDTALVTLRQKLKKAEQERNDLKLKLEKFQTSSRNLTELLASQTNKKSRSGYNSQVFTCAMFDCDDYLSSESDCESWPSSSLYDRFQPSGGHHVVPLSYTGTFMSPKPNLVFNTAHDAVETDHPAFTVSDSEDESETKALQIISSFVQSFEPVTSPRHFVQPVETSILDATPTLASPQSASSGKRRNKKACFVCKSVDHLIKDLLTPSKPVFNTAVRPVSAAMPKINVTRPRYAHPIVTKSKSPIRRPITRSPSPKTSNSSPRVTVVQAPVVSAAQGMQGKWGNPQYALKDKGVIDSGCSWHMTGNIVSQMCDKKNSVLFTDTECLVLSPDFKLPDETQVLLRVPRENNMYNVNLKNIVPSGDLTCLIAKATIDESNLWHKRMAHINFKTINKLEHFARKCRSPKDSRRPGAADPQRRTVPVETSTSNALVSQCDGIGSYDWSYQAEEELANFALMAFSPSSSSSDKEVPSCSKSCSIALSI